MTKSILLIGLGRFGKHLAMDLYRLGHEVMAIDDNEERVDEMLPYVTSAQIGDSTNTEFLESLGIRNFDICFVAIGKDFQSSLETTLTLKELGARLVVSRASSNVHSKFLLRNGADEVIYPDRDIAEKVAVRYSANHVYDYIEVNDEYSIFEIPVAEEWVGKSIKEVNFRAKYKVSILGIKRGENTKLLPMADYEFDEKEHLMVIGQIEDVERLLKKFDHDKNKKSVK